MGLVASTIGTVLIVALILYMLGRKYPAARRSMGPTVPQTDTIRASQVERENPGLVQEDVRQMLAAQNALRERRGAPAMTADDLRRAVAEDELHRQSGRGPFGLD